MFAQVIEPQCGTYMPTVVLDPKFPLVSRGLS